MGFALGDGGHDVDGEVVGFGHVDGDEADAGFHEAGDDGDVAGEAVELGDEEDPTNSAGVAKGGFELGAPALPRAGFDLGEFEDDLKVLTASVSQNGSLLSFETQAALTLFGGTDSVVGDGGGGHGGMLQD
ncbi:hypothetical protein GCM10010914_30020 [Deinococcus wulumuqiensis]|uniref:Calcium-binding protein n=1 Tax=Deinococcus wulumuqiensis TaxID=980427 RepID=A0AAV4K7S5_9DEIO|nr:hypothetical protein GCM10010914_30020 [Deinococcus wulumuqiensis]GGP31252.1 hypothetical protein GCM10008021_29030 [Deinococcus wulumuqiensis]